MVYQFLSYSTNYDSTFSKIEEGEKKVVHKVGGNNNACFSSFYRGAESHIKEDDYIKENYVTIDMSVRISRGTKLLKNSKDNYCHLSKKQIEYFVSEIGRVYGIKIELSEDEEDDMYVVSFTLDKATTYKAKYMPCLVRYLYEKEYMLLLCLAMKLDEMKQIKGYGLFQYLMLTHRYVVGSGHVGMACPANHKQVPNDAKLREIFDRRIIRDYNNLESIICPGAKINKVSLNKPTDTNEIDAFIEDHASTFIDSLGIEGFFE